MLSPKKPGTGAGERKRTSGRTEPEAALRLRYSGQAFALLFLRFGTDIAGQRGA
jgi:hypothetical protein